MIWMIVEVALKKIPSFATTSQSGVPYQFPNHLRWSGRPSITPTKHGKVNKTYQEKQEVRKIQNSNINKLMLCCLIILLNLDVHLLTMAIWRHFGSYSKHLASQPFVDWILDLRLTRAKVQGTSLGSMTVFWTKTSIYDQLIIYDYIISLYYTYTYIICTKVNHITVLYASTEMSIYLYCPETGNEKTKKVV